MVRVLRWACRASREALRSMSRAIGPADSCPAWVRGWVRARRCGAASIATVRARRWFERERKRATFLSTYTFKPYLQQAFPIAADRD